MFCKKPEQSAFLAEWTGSVGFPKCNVFGVRNTFEVGERSLCYVTITETDALKEKAAISAKKMHFRRWRIMMEGNRLPFVLDVVCLMELKALVDSVTRKAISLIPFTLESTVFFFVVCRKVTALHELVV